MNAEGFRKYLAYAVGEILLVMIGILLALQVNNWSHKALERKEEKNILNNLHKEFSANKNILKERYPSWQKCVAAGNELLKQCGREQPALTSFQIDSIFIHTFDYRIYNPPQPILDELLNNGKLTLIKDISLIEKLYEWKLKTSQLEDRYRDIVKLDSDIIDPYLYEHISYINLDVSLDVRQERSLLKDKTMDIFQDLKFENIMADKVFRIGRGLPIFEELDQLIDEIMDKSKAK
jgi:hypothetical protein